MLIKQYVQQIKIQKKKYSANNSNNYIIKINNLSDAYFKLWKKNLGLKNCYFCVTKVNKIVTKFYIALLSTDITKLPYTIGTWFVKHGLHQRRIVVCKTWTPSKTNSLYHCVTYWNSLCCFLSHLGSPFRFIPNNPLLIH